MVKNKQRISVYYLKISVRALLLMLLAGLHKPDFAQTPLPPPIVDSVSINANGNPILKWNQNPDIRTTGYKIVRWDPNILYHVIDSVSGIDQTSYIDNSISPCNSSRPIKYHVYSFGFSNDTAVQSPWSDSVKTIYLGQPNPDICANTNTLHWTAYINMLPQLKEYQIFASTTGENGIFQKIGTSLPTETSFIHTNLAPNTTYTYMIRAVNSDGTKSSSSCKKTIGSQTLRLPDSLYLRYASVENNEHVKLGWTSGNNASVLKYKILRSTDGSTFDTIGENFQTGDFHPDTIFIDNTANFTTQSYTYQIRACDSCGADVTASENLAKTIYLRGFPGSSGTTNELTWTPYEGWDLGIQEYRIFRRINGTPNPTNPFIVSANTTTYSDTISSLGYFEGVFNYFVQAVENDGNNGYEDFKDNSTSNEIQIIQETRVSVPNAFTPELATNNIFKPFTIFINPDFYNLTIFNKWGQMIFSTSNRDEGWNGKFNGEYVDADSYVYLIRYRTPEGKNQEKRGTVTVIR